MWNMPRKLEWFLAAIAAVGMTGRLVGGLFMGEAKIPFGGRVVTMAAEPMAYSGIMAIVAVLAAGSLYWIVSLARDARRVRG